VSNVNWNLYKYFVVVYETRNYHRAAEKLGVSPSAVLQNMKELSNQLGFALFTASRKGVEPTSDANDLYSQMKKATEIISVTENKLKAKNSGGVVRIAAQSLFAKNYIYGYIKEFHAQNPTIQIEIIQSDDVNLIKQKKLDFIINWDLLFKGTDLKTLDMFNKDVTLYFVATKNYLNERGLEQNITKAELIKQPIIERSEFMSKFREHVAPDFTPTEINAQANEQIFEMVQNGLGIGLFSEFVLQSFHNPDIVRLNVTDMIIPPSRLVCAYSETLSRPSKAFLDGLAKFCRVSTN